MTLDSAAQECGVISQEITMRLVSIEGAPTLGTRIPCEVQVLAKAGRGFRSGKGTSEWCAPEQPWLELLQHSGFLPRIVQQLYSSDDSLPAPEELLPGRVICNFTVRCKTIISEDALNPVDYTMVKEGLFNVIYSNEIINCGYLIPVELGELEIRNVLQSDSQNRITNFYLTQLDPENNYEPVLPDETWDFALAATDGGPSAYEGFLFAALTERAKAGESMIFGEWEYVMKDSALPLYLGIAVDWDQTEIVQSLYSDQSKPELTQQAIQNAPDTPDVGAAIKRSWSSESFSQILLDRTFLRFAGGTAIGVVVLLLIANIFAPKIYVPATPNAPGQSQNR